MFPYSMNFVAGLLQQVCQLCEEQPGRDAEASDEKSYSLQKSSTFFLELELKEGVGICKFKKLWLTSWQVLVLGALVGLGAAQFLVILFSLCLCRVLNHQSHFLFPGNASVCKDLLKPHVWEGHL